MEEFFTLRRLSLDCALKYSRKQKMYAITVIVLSSDTSGVFVAYAGMHLMRKVSTIITVATSDHTQNNTDEKQI